jgi:ribosome biogenesis GTPase A
VAELRRQKPSIKVLSKSDLADPPVTEAWLRHLDRPAEAMLGLAIRADRPGETRARIAELSARLCPRGSGPNGAVRAIIVGVPNVGKSTLINTLMNRAVAAVGDKPAVTKAQQQVVLASGMVLWDSPGIMWPKIEDEAGALRLALAGSIPDTAIDYLTVATFGAGLFLSRYPERLSSHFKLAELPEQADALLAAIGRRRGCLRSGGVVDLHKAAEILVHAFRSGGLGRISLESPGDERGVEARADEEGERAGKAPL